MCRSLVRFWDLKTALREAVTRVPRFRYCHEYTVTFSLLKAPIHTYAIALPVGRYIDMAFAEKASHKKNFKPKYFDTSNVRKPTKN